MKKFLTAFALLSLLMLVSCKEVPANTSAIHEQAQTEVNQSALNSAQPAPRVIYSLERENLINRFKLMNDRSIVFYMYVFIEGFSSPIGYYQVNKVSSVNSQLTNTEQIVIAGRGQGDVVNAPVVLPSPAEDGSYGTNGDAVFGFTPEQIYIEHNMKYMVSTVPLSFRDPVNKLTIINVATQKQLTDMMNSIRDTK
jgi:hypothetical protein